MLPAGDVVRVKQYHVQNVYNTKPGHCQISLLLFSQLVGRVTSFDPVCAKLPGNSIAFQQHMPLGFWIA
jgi:hypothetical protein